MMYQELTVPCCPLCTVLWVVEFIALYCIQYVGTVCRDPISYA